VKVGQKKKEKVLMYYSILWVDMICLSYFFISSTYIVL